jgi:uncharacterized iron-regulated membrane protein
MSVLGRLIEQPQRVWLRRAMFQIHLWTGIAIGLYVVVLSVTGSVLVYRAELAQWVAAPRPVFDPGARQLSSDELRAAAERAHPGYAVTSLGDRISRASPTIGVSLERGDDTKERLLNPYTGEDLGDAVTRGELGLIWIARLHDELLFDRTGKYVNGAGSLVFTVLVLTGAFVWWPGISRWRRSLTVGVRSGWKRANWDLHSALGFWLFLFMLVWGISGIYLGIPEPFAYAVDAVSDPTADYGDRLGDVILLWLTWLHFGRWRSELLKAAWAVVGLVPAVMFVTGTIMWWQRVVRPWWRKDRVVEEGVLETARAAGESSR